MRKVGKRLTHDAIVNRKGKEYSADWIVLKEVSYGEFIFDLLAFNPKTKELEITEVDLSSSTNSKKVEFAKTLGKTKIFRNLQENLQIKQKKFQPLINALGNPLRIAILELLYDNGLQRYTDMANSLKFDIGNNAGTWAYHVNILKRTGLISKNEERKYAITPKGEKIVRFFKNLK